MRTSTRCTRGGPQWRTRFASGVKITLTLCLLFIISQNSRAQCVACSTYAGPAGQIVIDGNPCDWRSSNLSGVVIKTYTADPFGSGVVDNSFTQGSKDFMLAADLRW